MHIVFSTKERRPLISEDWRSRFHEYIGGTVQGLQGVPEAVGGVADHVHLLVGYRPTLSIADFLRELKKSTSVWATEMFAPAFGWQDGYSVFSVSTSQKTRVANYIARQLAHHYKSTFREGLEERLRRHEIDFKPEYLD